MTSLFESSRGPTAPMPDRAAARGGAAVSQSDPDGLLADLNPPQRQAVTHRGEPLLIVAGAGSGKTRVLTRRIAYLLATGAARPGEVLAITFTNKAAREMRERVTDAVGRGARAITVSTFHSLCVRILRAESAHLPIGSGFTIYDAADSQRLMKIVAGSLDLDTKKHTPKSLAAAVSNLKNELVTPEIARDRAESDLDTLVAEVYAAYQRRLIAASAYDFDDLILATVLLLQSRPAVAEHYRRRFRHVMVDEYQDTNHAQYVLVRELVGGTEGLDRAELVVVGDADQSIYAFRGASIRNITEFGDDYSDARTILLEQNYRSTQTILSAANAVIAADPRRRRKNLWTDAGDGERIVGYVGDDEYEEARFVSDEIDRLCDAGEAVYGDVAVFYRTNAASRAIEDVFVRSGMPYRIVGGVRFYERKEVKDALAYLRVVANPDDEVSLRRILNTPKRGIGDKAQATVAVYAEQERIGFAEALRRYDEIPYLAGRSATAIRSFAQLLDGIDEVVGSGGDPADVLTAVLERTGYRALLDESDDPQDDTRLENLEQLVTVLREQAELLQQRPATGDGENPVADDTQGPNAPNAGALRPDARRGDAPNVDAQRSGAQRPNVPGGGASNAGAPPGDAQDGGGQRPDAEKPDAQGPNARELLGAVLENLALVADADSVPDSEEGVVTLMTLHTAKGLEFDVVFVTGWEDGIFPHVRSMGDEKQLSEERRLAYVGITRARQRLYLTRSVSRSAWGNRMENPPSRFLDDVPDSLVDWRRLPEETEPFVERSGYGSERSAPLAASTFGSGRTGSARYGSLGGTPRKPQPKRPPLRLAAGDRVTHDKYGMGTVTEVSGSGQTAQAVIDFGSSGTVRLMLIGGVPMTKL